MTTLTSCPKCGLHYQCLCSALPNLKNTLHIALLTHKQEQYRDTNTGRFVEQSLTNARIHLWQRTHPSELLQKKIDSERYHPYLLYPSNQSISLDTAFEYANTNNKIPCFIVLDGTWQEAKKMERKSPWLDTVERVSLTPSHPSQFSLRRNQQENALCTIEVVSELLASSGDVTEAEKLRHFFHLFMATFKADKSGHVMKKNPPCNDTNESM